MKPLAWLLIASFAPAFAAEKQASSRFVFFRPWAKNMQTHDPGADGDDVKNETGFTRRVTPRYSGSQIKKNANFAPSAERQLVRITRPPATSDKH